MTLYIPFIFDYQKDCFTFEDGKDGLSRNVGQ